MGLLVYLPNMMTLLTSIHKLPLKANQQYKSTWYQRYCSISSQTSTPFKTFRAEFLFFCTLSSKEFSDSRGWWNFDYIE